MANKFTEHAKNNPEIYFNLLKNGYISEDDIKTASNKSGETSFKDQDAALERINEGIKKAIDKNPNLKDQLTEFYEGTPKVEKFTPNKKDWREYNQDQIGRLAEQMKFNWKNKEDRKQMIKELSDLDVKKAREQAVNEDYSYLGMDKDNPINKGLNWLADMIISEDTKNAIIEDPSNTARIVGNAAADIGGTAADFLPGVGGVIVGPAIRTTRDIAEGKDAGDIATNFGKDLAANAVPYIGLKGIKGYGDDIPVIKNVTKKLNETVGKYADEIAKSNKKVSHNPIDVKPSKNIDEFQKQIDKVPKDQKKIYEDVMSETNGYKNKSKIESANKKANEERLKQRREQAHAEKWVKNNPGKVAVAQVFSQTAMGAAKTANQNLYNREMRKPTIEELYGDPELQSYIRLRKRGYSPKIPDKFKDYKEALDAEIFDFDKNLR